MRDKAPLVSVIMPNYNGERFIARSIESVLRQTVADFELIIVDDGSEDKSVAVVRNVYDERIRLIEQAHKGVCAARNRALEVSRGEMIAFLDSDDTWTGQFFAEMIQALHGAPDSALAYCGWMNIGKEGNFGKAFVPPDYETPEKLELCLRNCRWPIHAALTKRTEIMVVGGFDERYATSEDYLLWLRIVTTSEVTRVPKVLAFYHHHDGPQATKDRANIALNHLSAQQSYITENPTVVRTIGQEKLRELTYGELLARGYECYWHGDLEAARRIFRRVMTARYGRPVDWKRMLPSLFPLAVHKRLVQLVSSRDGSS